MSSHGGINVQLTESVVEQVVAMRKKEETCYNYRNCFPEGNQDQTLNVTWREKICHWCYNVVDHFDLSREVVSISLNLFDRFLATRGNKCNGNMALLTSLSTLHLAIKMHETKKIKLSTLANLSRGQFGPSHIEDMEWTILSALEWKIHPPTENAFISHLLVFLPQETLAPVRKDLMELSRYLSELAVCDSYFCDFNASSVAFASILNVMEDMSYSRLSAGTRERFLSLIADKVGLCCNTPQVLAARERIRAMFSATIGYETSGVSNANVISPTRIVDVSPGQFHHNNRSRNNSVDSSSKSSCRYSASPASATRRCTTVVSPMTTTRGGRRLASSPIVASVQ